MPARRAPARPEPAPPCRFPHGRGPTTPALVVAAAEAGAVGFLAGGYKTAAEMAPRSPQVRCATPGAFGVNVFVPGQPTRDARGPGGLCRARWRGGARHSAPTLGAPTLGRRRLRRQARRAPGRPAALGQLHLRLSQPRRRQGPAGRGTLVAITVTTPDEAVLAEQAGVDCLCLQGAEAGGPPGQFRQRRPPRAAGLPAGRPAGRGARHSDLPLIAAGGIAGPETSRPCWRPGRHRCSWGRRSCGAPRAAPIPLYKAALADPRFTPPTAITRAFSGRRARSLVNEFVRAHEGAPAAYPEMNNATRPLRAAAAAAGDSDRMSLYAGEGFRAAEERSGRRDHRAPGRRSREIPQ